MKKSFLVLICIVFVASFVVVGLVGLNFRNTAHVYTNSIECNEYYYSGNLSDDSIGESFVFDKKNEKGENYAVLDYVEGMKITLSPQAYPLDASILTGDIKSEYPYTFHTSSSCVTVDEHGVVTFLKPGTATIRISPADRSDIFTTVLIRAKEIKN
ncbi:MAG: hypothetical protein J6V82_03650 [Clostridia bacterium]|nr:hypothetical protein [Clostridia bacterium]MBO7150825.1 hypothetical protein [Clostridia bacterium]